MDHPVEENPPEPSAEAPAEVPSVPVAERLEPLVARLAASVPDLGLAAVFFVTWLAPNAFGERVVAYLMLVMLLEFLIVHASGMLGSVVFEEPLAPGMRAKSLLGLGGFYLLFAGALSLAFQAWWPLWTIALLLANRLLIVLTGELPEGTERLYIRRGWAVAAFFYLGFVFLTLLLPVPRLGLSEAVVASQNLPGSGLWIDEPHRVIAFGFLYFLATGVSELVSHRWLPAGSIPRPEHDQS